MSSSVSLTNAVTSGDEFTRLDGLAAVLADQDGRPCTSSLISAQRLARRAAKSTLTAHVHRATSLDARALERSDEREDKRDHDDQEQLVVDRYSADDGEEDQERDQKPKYRHAPPPSCVVRRP